ncbi:MAG: hypothetical protein WA970_21225 [Gammaproteobacteria bacterium]
MPNSRQIGIAAFAVLAGPLGAPVLMANPEAVFQNPTLAAAPHVSQLELDAERGRYKPELAQFNSQELEAVLEDNSAIGTTNGHNTVANQAFTNAQGHLSVIQNSGNNVIIQDTTIYNITFIN